MQEGVCNMIGDAYGRLEAMSEEHCTVPYAVKMQEHERSGEKAFYGVLSASYHVDTIPVDEYQYQPDYLLSCLLFYFSLMRSFSCA